MLYDASRTGNAGAQLFDLQHWQAQRAANAVPAGRGAAVFIDDGTRRWVLRHYRRGGLLASLLGDRYFWFGETRSRPFREYRLLDELRREGLPVPAPVAARYERTGPMYRADLITERISDASPLSSRLATAEVPLALWRAIGACIRRFHERGVWHADLNAHNILIDAQERIWIIDLDRGRRRAAGGWRDANLRRLRRSLDKIGLALPAGRCGEPQWRSLLEGYGSR